jgi:hypothetical protein
MAHEDIRARHKFIAVPNLERFTNPFSSRHQQKLHDDGHLNEIESSRTDILNPEYPPSRHETLTGSNNFSHTHQPSLSHSAEQDDPVIVENDKHDKVPLWKKFTHKRSKSHSDTDESENMNQPSTASKIKSAFTKIKPSSGANTTTVKEPPHEDGESTELEDSSDTASFHSTTPFPEEFDHLGKSTRIAPESPNVEAEVTEINSSLAHITAEPALSIVDMEERSHQERRIDKLKGAHLETKFHEEL